MSGSEFQKIKFKFENFAGVDTCEFSISPLTVITGPNSAGKTYIVYAVYAFLKELDQLLQISVRPQWVRQLHSEGAVSIDLAEIRKSVVNDSKVGALFAGMLPRWFSVSEDFFEGASISIGLPEVDVVGIEFTRQAQVRKDVFVDFSKAKGSTECIVSMSSGKGLVPPVLLNRVVRSAIAEIMFGRLSVRPFAITSERTGISLFWKELDINKNQLIDKLIESKGKKFDPWDLLDDQTSRYAMPITDNIDVARDAESVAKLKSFIAEDRERFSFVREPFDKISLGKYKYNKDGISFEYGRGKKKVVLPIYVASSSTKSLFLLDLFINHVASPGDLLVFDEPELNLHPANQRLMAQVIARLIYVGVNVIVTTHSDFLIRELNNRIMLDGVQDEVDVLKKAGVDPREIISRDKVSGLLLSKSRKLERVAVGEFGLDMRSIDEAIVGASILQSRIVDLVSEKNLANEERF